MRLHQLGNGMPSFELVRIGGDAEALERFEVRSSLLDLFVFG